MKTIISGFFVLILLTTVFSCKNDIKAPSVKAEKTELTNEDKQIIESVMTKAMMTEEAKTFVSASITTGVYDVLSTESGPFTVLAPENTAFQSIPAATMKELQNPKNVKKFRDILEMHIIKGEMDSATLLQSLKKNGGSITLKTISRDKITALIEGDDIVFQLENGDRAIMGKSDIKGGNGVLHIVNKVMLPSK